MCHPVLDIGENKKTTNRNVEATLQGETEAGGMCRVACGVGVTAVATERGQRQRRAPALSSIAGTAGTASGVVRRIGVFRSSCRGPGACRQRGCSRHPSYGPPCASPAAAKTARTSPTIPRLKRTSEPWSSLQEHGPARSGEKMGRGNLGNAETRKGIFTEADSVQCF
jgi:hypothetical protein